MTACGAVTPTPRRGAGRRGFPSAQSCLWAAVPKDWLRVPFGGGWLHLRCWEILLYGGGRASGPRHSKPEGFSTQPTD
jgi:hypothetical protein